MRQSKGISMEQNLNASQRQAVLHREGPMMVLAGPGSGKTTVITRRIEYLIKEAGINPSGILVITFTKAAAKEMKERFLSILPIEGKRVTFGTFHAVFFMILKYAYHFEASNVIREEEKMQFMRETIYALGLECEDEAEWIRDLYSEISFLKNGRIALENYYPLHCGKDVFGRIFLEYQKFLKRHRKIDFDDMLAYTCELFSQRKDILSAWQKKYRYILIDEFQDVNQIQYDIVRMLAEPAQNLFVVGDDDQSIYRFRGAKPEIMLHMSKDYPKLKTVKLSYNYRCPKDVVCMANKIIANNRERFQKEIIAAKTEKSVITKELFETQREENLKVIERIRAGVVPFKKAAVLYRTNTQAWLLMEQLMEYNIPFTAKDKTPNMYEHWIAKDLFAYFRLAAGSLKRRDFLMIMNRPKRYLSRESLEKETVSFGAWQAFYSEQPWMEERIEKLKEDLFALRKMRPFAAINYIRKAVGYDGFLEEYADYRKIEKEGLFEVMDSLQESSRAHASFEEWLAHIERYKKELQEAGRSRETGQDAVTLATFHSSKGLEFDAVHIIDVNEGITPYKKAVLPADMEEERRMFYVAVTRARKELHLYAAKRIRNKEAERSRFWIEAEDQSSSNSASSKSSSNRSSTASNSSSSRMFSREGFPSSSSK